MGAVTKHEGGAAFDYAALTGNVATAAREAAARIRERIRGQQVAIFDIGRDLIAMKEALGHGHFMAWIEAEFGMSAASAKRFMNVAENLDVKFVTVTNLPAAVIYALAAPSTPPELRQAVAEAGDANAEPEAEEVRERIKAARDADREHRADAKRTPGQKAYRRKTQRRDDQEKAERDERERVRQERIVAAADMIREAMGDRLGEFLGLFDGVSSWTINDVLVRLSAEPHAETVRA